MALRVLHVTIFNLHFIFIYFISSQELMICIIQISLLTAVLLRFVNAAPEQSQYLSFSDPLRSILREVKGHGSIEALPACINETSLDFVKCQKSFEKYF